MFLIYCTDAIIKIPFLSIIAMLFHSSADVGIRRNSSFKTLIKAAHTSLIIADIVL